MESWRIACSLYAQTREHQARVRRAEATIAAFLELARHPYVACSFGKDSICLLHLATRQWPDIPIRFLRSGESHLLHDFDRVIQEYQERFGPINLHQVFVDRVFSEEWQDKGWEESRKAGRGDWRLVWDSGDFDGILMGLREEESVRRRISLRRHRLPGMPYAIYRYRSGYLAGAYRGCPLDKWTVRDVGAYIVTHNLPLLQAYQELGLEVRTTARMTGDAARQAGMLAVWKQDLSRFNQLCARFPELRAFL